MLQERQKPIQWRVPQKPATHLTQTDDRVESPTSTPDDDDTGVSGCQPGVWVGGDLGLTRHIRSRNTFFVCGDEDFPIRNAGFERVYGCGRWSVFDISGTNVETGYEWPS